MSYTRIDDHKKADSEIDWASYQKAQVANGEICIQCKGHILFGCGHPRKCSACENMSERSGEVCHKNMVRCPHCGTISNPSDHEMYELYEEGEHDVSCPQCDESFEVSTAVSYTFTSPERITAPAEEQPVTA